MQDMDQALKWMPGKKKLNLHASYAIFEEGERADRDRQEPKHFAKWVEFAKERNIETLQKISRSRCRKSFLIPYILLGDALNRERRT